jgi:hypothetical protein
MIHLSRQVPREQCRTYGSFGGADDGAIPIGDLVLAVRLDGSIRHGAIHSHNLQPLQRGDRLLRLVDGEGIRDLSCDGDEEFTQHL